MLTDEQCRTIGLLIELARAVDRALDDSEECIGDDGRFHSINGPDFDELSDALEKLEELPDDKPGETLGAGGKAEWALRSILAGAAPHDATMSTDEQARADRDLLLYGESFMVDGKRVSPERVRLQCAPSVKAAATAPTKPSEGREKLCDRMVCQRNGACAGDDIARGRKCKALATSPTMNGEIVGYLVDDPNEPDIGHWFDEGKPNRELGLRARTLTFAAPTMSEAGRRVIEAARRVIGGGIARDIAGNRTRVFMANASDADALSTALSEIEQIERIDRAAAKGEGDE